MKLVRALVLGGAAWAGAIGAHAPAAPPICAMSAPDRDWIEHALANWRVSERVLLKLDPVPLPAIVAIDAQCTYLGHEGSNGAIAWTGEAHGEMVRLPDGKQTPLGPISFASPDNGAASSGYFAMSLPSVWRAAGVKSTLGLERLMDGVLLHELMHARQFYFANPALAAIQKRFGLGDDIGDDSLQDRFKSDAAYVAAYEAERDKLYAAAAAPSDAEARRLAGEALAMLRARRAHWFTATDAQWQPLDDIFLTMEGLGQWLAYAWFVAPQGQKLEPAIAQAEIRRGKRYWTQDEGLALFLTIDRLVPDWQKLAFAPRPALAEELLARASGEVTPPH